MEAQWQLNDGSDNHPLHVCVCTCAPVCVCLYKFSLKDPVAVNDVNTFSPPPMRLIEYRKTTAVCVCVCVCVCVYVFVWSWAGNPLPPTSPLARKARVSGDWSGRRPMGNGAVGGARPSEAGPGRGPGAPGPAHCAEADRRLVAIGATSRAFVVGPCVRSL